MFTAKIKAKQLEKLPKSNSALATQPLHGSSTGVYFLHIIRLQKYTFIYESETVCYLRLRSLTDSPIYHPFIISIYHVCEIIIPCNNINIKMYTRGTVLLRLSETWSMNWSGTRSVTWSETGNITRNLTGNITGNITGKVTGNITGNVT